MEDELTPVKDFAALVNGWAEKYPDYDIVICNCIRCRQLRPWRADMWAINHAEKKIYL